MKIMIIVPAGHGSFSDNVSPTPAASGHAILFSGPAPDGRGGRWLLNASHPVMDHVARAHERGQRKLATMQVAFMPRLVTTLDVRLHSSTDKGMQSTGRKVALRPPDAVSEPVEHEVSPAATTRPTSGIS